MMHICVKCHSNLSNDYRDIASHKIGVNRQMDVQQPDGQQTDRQTAGKHNASATGYRQRHKKLSTVCENTEHPVAPEAVWQAGMAGMSANLKSGQFILRKITKVVATRCQIF